MEQENILIVATKYGCDGNKWLTNELAEALVDEGKKVYVIALSWLSTDKETSLKKESGICVYRYKLHVLFFSSNKIIKFFKQFIFSYFALRKAKNIFKNIKFDLIIGFTPAYTTGFLVNYFKKRDKAESFLVLWDFFPYYLIDLKLINSRIFFYILKIIEKRIYCKYDVIGCMSPKNLEFLLENYKVNIEKTREISLWTEIKPFIKIEKKLMREKYGFAEDDIIFVYGGAMSVVQKLGNVLDLAKKFRKNKTVKFLMIGRGNEKDKLEQRIKLENIDNVFLREYITRKDYELLLGTCDIGLIALSEELKVPSFPSKSVDYCKMGIPIVAALDKFTDFGIILENDMKSGFHAIANDIENLYLKANKLVDDKELRIEMGKNGRKYYEKSFDVKNVVKKILQY